MAKVPLTLAIGEYDHVRDLFDGTVPVVGADLNVLRLPVEEMFYRFLLGGEFDVSEVSFGKIVAVFPPNKAALCRGRGIATISPS